MLGLCAMKCTQKVLCAVKMILLHTNVFMCNEVHGRILRKPKVLFNLCKLDCANFSYCTNCTSIAHKFQNIILAKGNL